MKTLKLILVYIVGFLLEGIEWFMTAILIFRMLNLVFLFLTSIVIVSIIIVIGCASLGDGLIYHEIWLELKNETTVFYFCFYLFLIVIHFLFKDFTRIYREYIEGRHHKLTEDLDNFLKSNK